MDDGRNDDRVSGIRWNRRRLVLRIVGVGDAVDTVCVWANDRLLDQDITEGRAEVFRQPRTPLDSGVVYPVCGS